MAFDVLDIPAEIRPVIGMVRGFGPAKHPDMITLHVEIPSGIPVSSVPAHVFFCDNLQQAINHIATLAANKSREREECIAEYGVVHCVNVGAGPIRKGKPVAVCSASEISEKEKEIHGLRTQITVAHNAMMAGGVEVFLCPECGAMMIGKPGAKCKECVKDSNG